MGEIIKYVAPSVGNIGGTNVSDDKKIAILGMYVGEVVCPVNKFNNVSDYSVVKSNPHMYVKFTGEKLLYGGEKFSGSSVRYVDVYGEVLNWCVGDAVGDDLVASIRVQSLSMNWRNNVPVYLKLSNVVSVGEREWVSQSEPFISAGLRIVYSGTVFEFIRDVNGYALYRFPIDGEYYYDNVKVAKATYDHAQTKFHIVRLAGNMRMGEIEPVVDVNGNVVCRKPMKDEVYVRPNSIEICKAYMDMAMEAYIYKLVSDNGEQSLRDIVREGDLMFEETYGQNYKKVFRFTGDYGLNCVGLRTFSGYLSTSNPTSTLTWGIKEVDASQCGYVGKIVAESMEVDGVTVQSTVSTTTVVDMSDSKTMVVDTPPYYIGQVVRVIGFGKQYMIICSLSYDSRSGVMEYGIQPYENRNDYNCMDTVNVEGKNIIKLSPHEYSFEMSNGIMVRAVKDIDNNGNPKVLLFISKTDKHGVCKKGVSVFSGISYEVFDTMFNIPCVDIREMVTMGSKTGKNYFPDDQICNEEYVIKNGSIVLVKQ